MGAIIAAFIIGLLLGNVLLLICIALACAAKSGDNAPTKEEWKED